MFPYAPEKGYNRAMRRAVEDLQYHNLRIVVDKDGFSYGRDAVLLANFVRAGREERALDMGTGTGILAILVNGKTGARVTAVEIQPEAAALAAESVKLNGQDGVQVMTGDVREIHTTLGKECFDLAVCNPPYYRGGTASPDPARRQCTSQETLTMEDAAQSASRMLKNGGRFYLCYPAEGFAALCAALIQNGIQPKRVQLAYGGNRPYLALVEGKKGGREGLVWELPIKD